MKTVLNKKYLAIPSNNKAAKKTLSFIKDGKTIYQIECKADIVTPNNTFYVELTPFMGSEVEIKIDPEMDMEYTFADEIPMDGVYSEPYRPTAHFSQIQGWINDPNGMFYANGVYHLFFQYNPADIDWANMHWGHAVSEDLVHWKQLDTALFPDELGVMFSGSGFVDVKNASGLKTNENDVILVFYTAAGPRFTQCMAYSNDNGMTFKKYEHNPVVPHICDMNRDPKVIYCEELDKYLMIIFLEHNDYLIMVSDNLTSWKELKKVTLDNDGECPDIYPLTIDGERKWIVSGASDNYIVGRFEDGKYIIEQPSRHFREGTVDSYAAQTFNHTGDRIIRMPWHRVDKEYDYRFNGEMGVPCDMSLVKIRDEYYLRAMPVKEFDVLKKNESKAENVEIKAGNSFELKGLDKNAYEIDLSGDHSLLNDFEVSVFGYNFKFDVFANSVKFLKNSLPLMRTYDFRNVNVKIIIDALGVEIFNDDGLIYNFYKSRPDYNLNTLKITTTGTGRFDSIKAYSLENIWKK